MIALA